MPHGTAVGRTKNETAQPAWLRRFLKTYQLQSSKKSSTLPSAWAFTLSSVSGSAAGAAFSTAGAASDALESVSSEELSVPYASFSLFKAVKSVKLASELLWLSATDFTVSFT